MAVLSIHPTMRFLFIYLLLLLSVSTLCAQLRVTASGSAAFNADSVRNAQVLIRNHGQSVGLRIRSGRNRSEQNFTGLSNRMVRGTGKRFGLHTYIRATEGIGIGVLNDLGNDGDQRLVAVSNRLTDTGT